MSERPKLSLKKDFPPRLPVSEKEAFVASDFRYKANRMLDLFKKELYDSGNSPASFSQQWSRIRDLHDRITADLEKYRSAGSEEERASLESSVKENYARLVGDAHEDLQEARQEALLARDKEQGKVSKKKDSLPKIENALKSSVHAHVEEHVADTVAKESELRRRIEELEYAEAHPVPGALKQDSRESEILALETEVRGLEADRKEARRIDETTAMPESAEAENNASTADMSSSYAGEPTYKVPAIQGQTRAEARQGIARLIQQFDPIPPSSEPIALPDLSKENRIAKNEKFGNEDQVLSAEEGQRREAYFAALRKHQRSRSFVDAASERLGFKKGDSDSNANLETLKRGWLEIRAEQAKMRFESAGTRLAGRSYENKTGRDGASVQERYKRIYIARDAAFGAEAAEQKVRLEALASRDRNVIDKLYKNYANLPPKVKIFMSASFLGTAGAAAIAGGTVATLPIIALGLAGAGLRWKAEDARKKNDTESYEKLQNASKFTGIGSIVGWLTGKGTDKLQEKIIGSAEATLRDRSALGDLGDVENLQNLTGSLKSAHASLSQARARTQTVSTAAAIGGGILGGHAIGSGVEHFGGTHADAPAPVEHSNHPASEGMTIAQASPEMTAPIPPANHDVPAAPAPEMQGMPSSSPAAETVPPTSHPEMQVPEKNVETAAPAVPSSDPDTISMPDSAPTASGPETVTQTAAETRMPAESASPASEAGPTTSPASDASLTSEQKIAEIYAYQKEHAGLAPGSDAHIEDTIRHIESTDGAQAPEAHPTHEPAIEKSPIDAQAREGAGSAPPGPLPETSAIAGEPLSSPETPSSFAHGDTASAYSESRGESAISEQTAVPRPEALRATAPGDAMTLDQFNARLEQIADESASADGLVQNHWGVSIDTAHPARYEWSVPGTRLSFPVAVGGSPQEAAALAEATVTGRPESTVLFTTPVRDPLTGVVTARTDAWVSDAAGKVERIDGFKVPGAERAMPPISLEELTRKLP